MIPERVVSLDTIYTAQTGAVFMTGIQALVRLPMMQRRLDRARGLNTAGLVSGYRGSPLGAYDQQLWKARKWLEADDVLFQPGLNEDLAATALWGAQMHKAFGPSRADGVFGLWYGKGNGVDRTSDVFRNANMLGTSPLGGVLAVGGDDHAAQSSMFPHQTDAIFQAVHMPVLQPATVSEILSLGLAGIALSRYSGLWVGMKTIAEVVESAASFDLPDPAPAFVDPADMVPAHGLNWDPGIAWPAQRAELERRLIEERLPAAIGWSIANRIDRPVLGTAQARLCIVTVGKAHQDLMQALARLGLGEGEARALDISVYKVAMSWPLAVEPLLTFAQGARDILVIEEKAPTVENQIKAALFNRRHAIRAVTGKQDAAGAPLLPVVMEFTPLMVARAVVAHLPEAGDLAGRLAAWEATCPRAQTSRFPARKPFFCSGCPHNSSTRTPEGSITGGGIGCHVMALSQPRLKTATFSQMGGEGLQWVGAAPFSKTAHIFQNLGDGTYQHSGLLAIRAAVAAGTNITYKILYNDAVAMTGGQPAEGTPEPRGIIAQLLAEGVRDVRLVSDDPSRWTGLPAGVGVHHRDEMDAVQRVLRETAGVTAIVYEQTCAAEKRRRRKRGTLPDPDRRLFINPRVCEACGDCSVQSNCIAVQPLATPDGTKRRIDQSACNKDFSCLKGFCPSFVELTGAALRKPDPVEIARMEEALFPSLPAPVARPLGDGCNIYVAGIGGNGVLTTGALLGMAAHLDGLVSSVLDFTGLAQKNGAVVSQVRIAPAGRPIHAVRLGRGEADVVLAADALVAAAPDGLDRIGPDGCAMVLNLDETPTADAVEDRDARLPTAHIIDTLMTRAGERAYSLHATKLAEGLFGQSVAANTMLVGYAWQQGLLPVSAQAILGAIEANGAAVALNRRAFAWGRLAAVDIERVARVAGLAQPAEPEPALQESTSAMIERLTADLQAYGHGREAQRYAALMSKAAEATIAMGSGGEDLLRIIARQAYRVIAIKDEYEVARLYSEPAFRAALAEHFAESGRVSIYLAPPLFSRIEPATGRPRKRRFGPWILRAMAVLARGKFLRDTWFDPFGRSVERQSERALREDYLALIETLLPRLPQIGERAARALVNLPDMVRGFGPVKEEAMQRYWSERESLAAFLDQNAAVKPSLPIAA